MVIWLHMVDVELFFRLELVKEVTVMLLWGDPRWRHLMLLPQVSSRFTSRFNLMCDSMHVLIHVSTSMSESLINGGSSVLILFHYFCGV